MYAEPISRYMRVQCGLMNDNSILKRAGRKNGTGVCWYRREWL